MTKRKLPEKLEKLSKEKWIEKLHEKILAGEPLTALHLFVKSKKFEISQSYLNRYRQYYLSKEREKDKISDFLDGGNVGDFINKDEPITYKDKIKSNLEYIDNIIQEGDRQFKKLQKKMEEDESILLPPNVVFEAIKLKNQLTGGSDYNLTDYGIEYLQKITEEKYKELMRVMFSYIPEDKKDELIIKLNYKEEEFYSKTDYYEDYLISKGYTDAEIRVKLNEKYNKTSSR